MAPRPSDDDLAKAALALRQLVVEARRVEERLRRQASQEAKPVLARDAQASATRQRAMADAMERVAKWIREGARG